METFANQVYFLCFVIKYINKCETIEIELPKYKKIFTNKKALRNADEKLFDVRIDVLMSSIIVVAMVLYTLLDCIMREFESTENIKLKTMKRTKNSCLIFCLLLYLSGTIPLFWKRFMVYLDET